MMNQKILFIIALFFAFNTQAQKLRFYKVDTTGSQVLWKCDKHNGAIKLKAGGFVVDIPQKQPVAGRFIIDMHSITDLDMDPKEYGTAVLIFQNTLKNNFFQANQYPYALFNLEEVRKLTGDMYLLTGDFTLHGITNCLSFKAKIEIKDKVLTMVSEKFSVDRTDWGIYHMSPKRPYPDDKNGWTVSDQIDLIIKLKAEAE